MSGYHDTRKSRSRSHNRRHGTRRGGGGSEEKTKYESKRHHSRNKNHLVKSNIQKLNCAYSGTHHNLHISRFDDDELIDTVIGGSSHRGRGRGHSHGRDLSSNCSSSRGGETAGDRSTGIISTENEVDTVYIPKRDRGKPPKDVIMETRDNDDLFSSGGGEESSNVENETIRQEKKEAKMKYERNMKEVLEESDVIFANKITKDEADEAVTQEELLDLLLRAIPVLAKYGSNCMPKTKHAFCRALRKHPQFFDRDEMKDNFGHSRPEYREIVWEAYGAYQQYKDLAMKHMLKKHTQAHEQELLKKDEEITALQEQIDAKNEELEGVSQAFYTSVRRIQDIMNYLNEANDYRTVDVVKKDLANQARFSGLQQFIPNLEAWKKGYYSGFSNKDSKKQNQEARDDDGTQTSGGDGSNSILSSRASLKFEDPSHFKHKDKKSTVRKKQGNGFQDFIQDLLPPTATL